MHRSAYGCKKPVAITKSRSSPATCTGITEALSDATSDATSDVLTYIFDSTKVEHVPIVLVQRYANEQAQYFVIVFSFALAITSDAKIPSA
jgi:hypothetical protein